MYLTIVVISLENSLVNIVDNFIYNPPIGDPEILFEDELFVAADKLSGLLTVPGKKMEHQDSMFSRLRGKFKNLLVIHRLDMDTSGVVLFAKNKCSQSNLSAEFAKKRVKKIYLARVFGHIGKISGSISYPIARDWPNRPLQKICFKTGKASTTIWKKIGSYIDEEERSFSYLLIKPITGRTHQIRIHLAQLGHPVVGDRFYGDSVSKNIDVRLNLHAYSLNFYHNTLGKRLLIKSNSHKRTVCQFHNNLKVN